MKLPSSIFALFGAISLASASLNCTVKAGTTVDYKTCEYSSCQNVGQYKGGDLIMAACRSDCSSDTAVWFKLYPMSDKSYFADATNMTGCNYHGTNLAMTVLPYCYQESNIPKPTTCTATPAGIPPVIATTLPQPTGNPGGCSVQKYGQCGGQEYTWCKVCASGSACKVSNQWYSRCL